MKCPKCGYNSFEYNDNCPKCQKELAGYKAAHGLKAIVLPATARAEMALSMETEARVDSHPAEAADMTSDMFSFDFDKNEHGGGQGAGGPAHDPFNFDDEPANSSGQAQAKDDVFTGLLETAPRKSAPTEADKPAVANNDFDLKDFSWDDAPDPVDGGKPGKPGEGDFGSLFGGTKK